MKIAADSVSNMFAFGLALLLHVHARWKQPFDQTASVTAGLFSYFESDKEAMMDVKPKGRGVVVMAVLRPSKVCAEAECSDRTGQLTCTAGL
eukprot:1503431-Pleurochrysis_carterae.AAC.7